MKTIFEATVGSQAYNLNNPQSDTDTLAVHKLPFIDFLGTKKPVLTVNNKNDIGDFCSHEIGKVVSLIVGGNPTVTELLFAESNGNVPTSDEWWLVQENFDRLLSAKPIYDSYRGHAVQQLHRLKDTGEFSSQTINRRAKHARHLARLILQGTELLSTGKVTLMLSAADRDVCFEAGRLGENRDVSELEGLFKDLCGPFDLAYARAQFPVSVDFGWVNDFVVRLRS
jgi:uncharacterized protein